MNTGLGLIKTIISNPLVFFRAITFNGEISNNIKLILSLYSDKRFEHKHVSFNGKSQVINVPVYEVNLEEKGILETIANAHKDYSPYVLRPTNIDTFLSNIDVHSFIGTSEVTNISDNKTSEMLTEDDVRELVSSGDANFRVEVSKHNHSVREIFDELYKNLFKKMGVFKQGIGGGFYATKGYQTGTHCDPDNTLSSILLIEGEKKWKIFPPRLLKHIKYSVSSGGFIIPDDWVLQDDTLPFYYEVVQKAGDIVVFNDGWFHEVHNLAEKNFMITRRYFKPEITYPYYWLVFLSIMTKVGLKQRKTKATFGEVLSEVLQEGLES